MIKQLSTGDETDYQEWSVGSHCRGEDKTIKKIEIKVDNPA